MARADTLQSSNGVVRPIAEMHKRIETKQYAEHSYYLNFDDLMASSDGITFVASNQWGNQFPTIQKYVKDILNWDVEEVLK